MCNTMKELLGNFSQKVRNMREKRRNFKKKKNKSLYLNLVSGELKLKMQFDISARNFKEHCQYRKCL